MPAVWSCLSASPQSDCQTTLRLAKRDSSLSFNILLALAYVSTPGRHVMEDQLACRFSLYENADRAFKQWMQEPSEQRASRKANPLLYPSLSSI
jgi:hypothetical protein